MNPNELAGSEPRRPALVASAIFVVAALTLCWPMLRGDFLAGTDMYMAGYSIRSFGAEYFKAHGSIPLWNPYLLGGLPFVAAMHGDVFYPTAWLRWILPTDTAINLGFGVHYVLAGLFTYGFLRALRVRWAAAVIGGLSFELTGIVASMAYPGHDGKLFVSALTPLLFMALLKAVRDRKVGWFGVAGLTAGLSMFGHPQASYYLLVAGFVWGLFLVFADPEGPKPAERPRVVLLALLAMAFGFGLYAIQALPFMEYTPFSPRAEGGASSGWEHATSFAWPLREVIVTILPQFTGVLDHYTGENGIKLHTEYLGPVVLMLAILGIGGPERRRLQIGLGVIALLFLLVALGGHTPFYSLWYAVMPLMKKVRAAGMAYFLVAFVIAVFAGFGAERLLAGQGARRRIAITAGVIGVIALLGSLGTLAPFAESLAMPQLMDRAIANRSDLQSGSVRLLVFVLAGGAVLYAVASGRLRGAFGAALIASLTVADLWSVDHQFFKFLPGAAISYGDDEITAKIRETPAPYRVLDPQGRYRALTSYPRSWLMARAIPQLLGYHGNELRRFDELLGGGDDWEQQVNPNLLKLWGVRFLVLASGQVERVPGYHKVLGPVKTTPDRTAEFYGPEHAAVLFAADTVPAYVRLYDKAVKIPADQIAPTIADPRFRVDLAALYDDSAAVTVEPLDSLPPANRPEPVVTHWQPGRIEIALSGQEPKQSYLVVGENWFKGWEATADGKVIPVLRANHTMLSAVVPAGAKNVTFEFGSPTYRRGRTITFVCALGLLGFVAVPLVRRRRSGN
ncbi:MAG: hypothetical protein ABI647_04145, partial [Gemmatimonadota bacterium]